MSERIDPNHLEELLRDGRVFFLDVRDPEQVAALETIEGYTNIPLGELEGRLAEVPKDKLILTA